MTCFHCGGFVYDDGEERRCIACARSPDPPPEPQPLVRYRRAYGKVQVSAGVRGGRSSLMRGGGSRRKIVARR